MGVVLNIDDGRKTINVDALKRSAKKLSSDMISCAKEEVPEDAIVDHTSQPIKNIKDIMAMSRYFIDKGRYRDNMLFIVGINFGLRVSDLRTLRFSNLINDNLTFKDTFPVFEKKTRNTRKHKVNRYITINDAVIDAVTLYLKNTPDVSLSDYMFRSNSNHGKNKNEPLNRSSVYRILVEAANEVGLNIHFSTHTLRKTFCYHQMVMSNNSTRKLLLLQKMLNHSSPAQTLQYIGITEDEIREAYKNLNLGGANYKNIMDTEVLEEEVS